MPATEQTWAMDIAARLEFESMLADLSAQFVSVPTDDVDQVIEAAQRCICERLHFDICSLWQWTPDSPETFVLTHYHRAIAGPPVPKQMDGKANFPWTLRRLLAGEIVVISSTQPLLPGMERDREVMERFGIRTSLTFPLAAGGAVAFGALSFNTKQAERSWPETTIKGLRLVADLFANVLARRRLEKGFGESELRLKLETSTTGAGLWSLNLATGKFWLTDMARSLLGFAADRPLTIDGFLAVVHPEDQERVRQALDDTIRLGEERQVEYRISLPHATTQWILSRWQVQQCVVEASCCLMGVSLDITDRKRSEQDLSNALTEVQRLRDQLQQELVYLRQEVQARHRHTRIVGQSAALRSSLRLVEQVAKTDSTVLLCGETGTGKELFAAAIHELSLRREKTMITVNCAALPSALIESELFGREKGAYTGALTKSIGRFELADGSTLFLDEVAELPPELQVKLLRVLQEKQIERLGNSKPLRVNVRVVAATNQNLEKAVQEGRFRQDLYYRLNVFPITVPPLHDRREDIPLLVWSFVEEFGKSMGKSIESIPQADMDALVLHPWPGNVRELRNIIERAMILTSGPKLRIKIEGATKASAAPATQVAESENRARVRRVLEQTGWRIRGSDGAAMVLGLKPTTLESQMSRLGIHRPKLNHRS